MLGKFILRVELAVVERRTPSREVLASNPARVQCCVLSMTHLLPEVHVLVYTHEFSIPTLLYN